jgi:hypothetical protein
VNGVTTGANTPAAALVVIANSKSGGVPSGDTTRPLRVEDDAMPAHNDAPQSLALALAFAAALGLAGCGGGGGGGGDTPPPPPPPSLDPQYQASAATPFAAGCDGVAATGTLYVNAEVEPFIAVNPMNANNLVGVWQQDRWSNGGARANLTGFSADGGKTWTRRMAAFTRCSGGTAANGADYARASDPWVSFAPDGTAHQIAIAFTGADLAAGSVNAVLVSRSTDGGSTWSAPIALQRDGSDHFNDKESIAADTKDARYVYATWDRIAADDSGPTWFARSVDGGLSWEPARAIYDPGAGASTLNNQVVVLGDGTLLLFCTRFTTTGNATAAALVVLRSGDRGVSWSAPIVVAAAQAVGAFDPETRQPLRDGADIGAIAAGPGNSAVVVWQDGRFTQGARDAIAFARSTDGGLTWSAPVRINGDPSVQAFTPAVAVRADGAIGVSYFDFRSNTPDAATLPTDYWIARSVDGGATWKEVRLATAFDFAGAPNAEGLFLGDYMSLTTSGGLFVPFYVLATGNPANRTDVFASRVSSLDATAADAAFAGAAAARAATAAPLAPSPELAASAARVLARRHVGR